VAIARCVPSSESADFENRESNQWLADFLSANFRLKALLVYKKLRVKPHTVRASHFRRSLRT
jgi:hypothetical protein